MNQELWDKCVEFHGHSCPGLAIGFKAFEYAKTEMGLSFSSDEEIVCVTENDACGVDAIQVLAGTSFGKGNLIYLPRGKMAFTFFSRIDGRKLRFMLRDFGNELDREKQMNFLLESDPRELFDVKEITVDFPAKARLHESIICEICGEKTAKPYTRLIEGKKVCLDCSGYSENNY